MYLVDEFRAEQRRRKVATALTQHLGQTLPTEFPQRSAQVELESATRARDFQHPSADAFARCLAASAPRGASAARRGR